MNPLSILIIAFFPWIYGKREITVTPPVEVWEPVEFDRYYEPVKAQKDAGRKALEEGTWYLEAESEAEFLQWMRRYG